jgi:hypothetical protein
MLVETILASLMMYRKITGLSPAMMLRRREKEVSCIVFGRMLSL